MTGVATLVIFFLSKWYKAVLQAFITIEFFIA